MLRHTHYALDCPEIVVQKTVVLNIVGLTESLLGPETPNLNAFKRRGAIVGSVLPAVTCSVQSTYLTGTWPSEHGIVGNGWYFKDECEVKFWRQSNKLVQRPKIWEMAKSRDSSFTCANLFWWYNMYSSADFSVTPRPMYPSDGRKLPDVYSHPPELRGELQKQLGTFPLFQFWGPGAAIASSDWIAKSAIEIDRRHDATLTLVYLPHLDYCLQKFGPARADVVKELAEIDRVAGNLIKHFEGRGARVIVLSEYGIERVTTPVHLNRLLRENGLLKVREELGRELLDAGASSAFAVADHQIAHVYVNDASKFDAVRKLISATPGVARVLDKSEQREIHLDHDRSGDLVVLAAHGAWFTYYYWTDESRQPDFATTVDIHRKPGYDPCELFLDPAIALPKLKIAGKLMKKKLGFRYLMDVIPTDATLVKGSHGLAATARADAPVFWTNAEQLLESDTIAPTDVCGNILRHIFA